VLGNSSIGSRMIHAAPPIQSLLLMVFFLSVGLLLDLSFVWENLGTVLAVLLWVTLFKTALNLAALRLLRTPWPEAFLAGVALAQIGEFSFLLSSQGAALGMLGQAEAQFVVAVTVLSLMFSPLWLATLRRLGGGLARRRRMKTLGAVLDTVYGPEARKVSWLSLSVLSRLRGHPAPPPPEEAPEEHPQADPMPAMEADPTAPSLAPSPAEAYDTGPDQPPLEQDPAMPDTPLTDSEQAEPKRDA
jgi:CPA2 family monovalent cation:H+ antiporter-2